MKRGNISVSDEPKGILEHSRHARADMYLQVRNGNQKHFFEKNLRKADWRGDAFEPNIDCLRLGQVDQLDSLFSRRWDESQPLEGFIARPVALVRADPI